ncbi:OmpA family protein [Tunicatimonas pelagia]|uniref:OmpA family protein n=1 Tax=Tunicatimonas pelagia TaxID=931531 RepID=UPI0026652D64|nr:OmpA family protein [Tunicatimonas pelagia]WKN43896.1 OmpA family protein [Tunicatimonas pelagia]
MAAWKVIGLISCFPGWLLAQVQVDTSFTEDVLVKEYLLQSQLKVNDISYRGTYQALGLFSSESLNLPISRGIILSTGKATNAIGPNQSQGRSTFFHRDGDEKLSKLSGGHNTHDAAVLEFTFFPTHNTIAFDYLFASEEYPEYVNKGFNDVFAFVLTDLHTKKSQNLAVVPGTQLPVHIDHINATTNPEWFIANDRRQKTYYSALEYDGLTKMLSAQATVVPGRPYRIKLAISDVYDGKLDSGVILRKKSFRSFHTPPQISPVTVYFPLNSSQLSATAQNGLRQFAQQIITSPPEAIQVVGHTDALGTDGFNQQLSEQRVQSVVDFLASLGLKGKVKLYRQSQGEHQPVVSNDNEVGRAQNRRVEVVLVNQKQ